MFYLKISRLLRKRENISQEEVPKSNQKVSSGEQSMNLEKVSVQ